VFAEADSNNRLWLYTRERWICDYFIVSHAARMASYAGNDDIILLFSARRYKSGPPRNFLIFWGVVRHASSESIFRGLSQTIMPLRRYPENMRRSMKTNPTRQTIRGRVMHSDIRHAAPQDKKGRIQACGSCRLSWRPTLAVFSMRRFYANRHHMAMKVSRRLASMLNDITKLNNFGAVRL
jgi:hypothetical protein